MIRPLQILIVIIALALSSPALAAPSSAVDPVILNITVDRGVPVTLNAPAASVFVANPEVADVQMLSPTSVMIFGRRTGQTTFMASDSNGNTLIHRTIMVAQDLADLRLALNAVIPKHKIKVDAVPNGIVLTGEAADPAVVEDARKLAVRYLPKDGEVVNRIKVKGSNQIHIRVRFAEVSRDVDKRFGINWETIGNIGGFAFGLASGSNVLLAGAPAGTYGYSSLLGRLRPQIGNGTNDILSFSHSGGRWDVNGMIDALAQEGFVTVLAEPNLTAMSGETASFLAGGEFPVPVPQGLNQVTILWKQYGVSLAFTPTLVGEDRMSLHVKPEVSQLTSAGSVTLNNISVPGLSTRRAETTIELGSGQSFAIAGLLNSNQSQSIDKYPFLGDVPILGALFRSTRFQNDQSELVIIITPYIVRPNGENQMALPTDGFSPPSDGERLLDYRVSSGNPKARPLSGSPAAVKIEPNEAMSLAPTEGEPLAPLAAPVTPVSEDPEPVVNKVVSKKAYAPALPAATDGPAGPGGFILE
ncbi:MAG: type II and III secretion system protein family protein [Alphaproteobacteria bacterium]|nr:type II and III secretion system protein family protein [Alphaproteobacteria bacterium]